MTAKLRATLRLAAELLAYNLVLLSLIPVILLWLAWRSLVLRKPAGNWRHRLGLVPRMDADASPRIWLHAVSAGEMNAALPVLSALRQRLPNAGIAVSTHTETGMAVASKRATEADILFFLPFDWADTIALALWRLQPDLVIVVEKELWPNLLGVSRLIGARVVVINGRVSDRMMRRVCSVPWLVSWFYRLTNTLCVQSEHDAARLRRIGVSDEKIVVAGNTKIDTLAARDAEIEERLRADLEIGDEEIWLVAGSTHEIEEEQIVDAFIRIRKREPRARLLLAPRHLDRVPLVSAMVAEHSLDVIRRSDGRNGGNDAVVILDTMGELRAAYALATAGFVGGTLVPVGGHNLLEPPAVGIPVLFGPHTENCPDAAELVREEGVGFLVFGSESLADEFLRLVYDNSLRAAVAQRTRDMMARQRGAAARCAAVAARLLSTGES